MNAKLFIIPCLCAPFICFQFGCKEISGNKNTRTVALQHSEYILRGIPQVEAGLDKHRGMRVEKAYNRLDENGERGMPLLIAVDLVRAAYTTNRYLLIHYMHESIIGGKLIVSNHNVRSEYVIHDETMRQDYQAVVVRSIVAAEGIDRPGDDQSYASLLINGEESNVVPVVRWDNNDIQPVNIIE